MENFRLEKVHKFEEFVDHRLKPDLVRAIAERDKVFEQQKTFLDLRRNIENLEKNSVTSLRTLVNIGSEVYLQADVPDTQCIFVDIGLGFHVEFTWSEALNYISQREEKLARISVAKVQPALPLIQSGLLCSIPLAVLDLPTRYGQSEVFIHWEGFSKMPPWNWFLTCWLDLPRFTVEKEHNLEARSDVIIPNKFKTSSC